MSYRLVLVSFIAAFFFRNKYPRTLLFYHSYIILSYSARHGILNSYIELAGKGHYTLNKNFDNLYNLLFSLKFSPSIVAISETSRLKDLPLTNIFIPGYGIVHVDSENNAGSVTVYISN